MELEAAPAPAIVEATVAAHVAVATAAASVVQTSVQEEQPPNSGATAKEKVGKKEKTGKDKEVGTGNKRSYDEPTEEEQSALQEELEVEMQRERKRAKKEKKKAGGGQQPVLLKLPPTIRKAAQAVMYSDEEEEEAKDASYTPKRETVKKLRAKLQTAREELGVLQAGRLAAEEEVPVAVAELHDAAKMNKKDMDAIASSNAATRIYEILLGLNSRAAAPVAQFLEKYVQVCV
jgi:hypothetical protein